MKYTNRQGSWKVERGFTLIEVIITIIIMGIVLAIASSTWFAVVEGRRVDAATNQLAADLRLAHTKAANRLEQWQVVLDADSSYTIGPVAAPSPRDLDVDTDVNEVVVDTTATITFEPEGSAVLGDPPDPPPTRTIIVKPSDADEPAHEIEINAATSRIQIDP